MATRKKIPGVDKEALEGLANQFPRTQGPSSQDGADKPATAGSDAKDAKGEAEKNQTAGSAPPAKPQGQAEPEPAAGQKQKGGSSSAASGSKAADMAAKSGAAATTRTAPAATPKSPTPSARDVSSSGIRASVFLPLFVSLIALVLALAALSTTQVGIWFQNQLGYAAPIEFATGTRAEFEARLRENAAAIQLTENRLATQEDRIGMVEAGSGGNEAAANQDADVDRRLATLEKLLPGRLSKIEAKLGLLSGSNLGPLKLYLIALRLRVTAQGPEPFADQVKAAVRVGDQGETITAALDMLVRHAGNGVASRAQLSDHFRRRLAPLLRGDDMGAGRSLFVNFRTWFNGLFLDDGDDTMAVANAAAIVELAEQYLARDRLGAANEQVAQLNGTFAAAAAPWLAQARARVAVDAATATLLTATFDRFMAMGD